MPERAHSSVLHTPKHVRISVLYMPKQVLQCTSTITHLPCHINARRALFARVKNSSKNRLVEDAHAQTRTHFNHQVLNQRRLDKQLASCHVSSRPIRSLYFLIVFSNKFEQKIYIRREKNRKKILILNFLESFNVWWY